MISGLAHVCFTVSDLERSEGFYCELLGMQMAFDFVRDDGSRYGLYVHAGGRTFIELFQGNLAPKTEKQAFRHICLEVDGIESTVEALREKGVEVSDMKLGSDGSYQAWLEDPDGNRIELHGYTADSKQSPFLE
jgi:lactoylglutathione lyase